MSNKIKIAIDLMGGENSPDKTLEQIIEPELAHRVGHVPEQRRAVAREAAPQALVADHL